MKKINIHGIQNVLVWVGFIYKFILYNWKIWGGESINIHVQTEKKNWLK